MNLKSRVWDVMLILSLTIFAAMAWAGFALKPVKAPPRLNSRTEIVAMGKATQAAQDEVNAVERAIAAHTWVGSIDSVSARVLDLCNSECAKSHVQIVRFRVGTPIAVPNMWATPYNITIEGGFLGMMEFIKAFEADDSKVAMSEVRISNSNSQASDKSTANLVLTTFISRESK